ncbi:MAG: hypothetical protein OEN01_04645 [Candidatus Krumholzibacteria bacterium]|nr:hypothetical protein [Candidatus Krumholzibacteria bacterium]
MLRRMSWVAVAFAAALSYGCEDTQRPPPPPPPLQIDLELFSESKGLPDNDVFDILVDSQARTWISTDAGVFMTQGAQSQIFDEFSGIPNRKCRGLAEHNGKIFVGTWGGGLAFYDGSPMWTPLPIMQGNQPGLVSDRVFEMAADDTSLWVCTAAGVSQYKNDDALPMSERWVNHSRLVGTQEVVVGSFIHDDPVRGPEAWFGTQNNGIIVLRLPSLYGVAGVIDATAGLNLIAVGDNGSIMRFDGSVWRREIGPTAGGGALRGVFALRLNATYAVGDGGVLVVYNGNNWSRVNANTSKDLKAVWALATNNIYTVGAEGTIIRFNGNQWSSQTVPTTENLHGLWAVPGNIYAVGDNGTMVRSGGSDWQIIDSGTSQDLKAIWGSTANDIFAVGASGAILHFDGTWTAMASGTEETLTGVWGTSASNVFAVGTNATILHYDGVSWSPMTSSASVDLTLHSVWGDPSSDVFTAGGLSSYLNGSDRFFRFDGGTWSPMTAGTEQFLKVVRVQSSTSGLPGNQISDLIRDDQADLMWFTMPAMGVAFVDVQARKWTHMTQVDGFQSDLAMSLGLRSNGDLWVGTQVGVSRRERSGRIINFIASSGLPDPRVRKVYVDPSDQVWLAFVRGGAGRVKSPNAHK